MTIATGLFNLNEINGYNGFRLDGVASTDFSGYSVSGIGDINNDAYGDLIIGAWSADPYGSSSGSAYVVFGSESYPVNFNLSSLNGTNGFRLDGPAELINAGFSVSGAGDVNGDGMLDLVLGAPLADFNGIDSGSTYVIFGRFDGFPATVSLATLDGTNGYRIDGASAGDQSGRAVSNAGDVNGDGQPDLIIGAALADINGNSSGVSYVVFGRGFGHAHAPTLNLASLDGSNGFRLVGVAAGDNAGWSVSGAGDINSDGFHDVIVGANLADPNGSASGASYVVFGKADGFAASINLSSLDGSNGFRLDGTAAGEEAGNQVSAAGDVNGDGYGDLVISAFQTIPSPTNVGAAYVVFGKLDGYTATMSLASLDGNNGFRVNGVASGDNFGVASGIGDFNADGFADLIFGAGNADPNGSNSGSSYVIYGSAVAFPAVFDLTTIDGSNGFRIDGATAGDAAGTSVRGAGYINGDGYADLIIGAPNADPNGLSSGSNYVIFGRDTSLTDNVAPYGEVLISGYPIEGETLTASNTLYDVNVLGIISYQWFADDLPIDGATSDILELTSQHVGRTIAVTASYTDGLGNAESVRSADSNPIAHYNSIIFLDRLDGSNGFRLVSDFYDDQSGYSVSNAGDVNGDGIDDLIIGAPLGEVRGGEDEKINAGLTSVVFGKAGEFEANINLSELNGLNGFQIEGDATGDNSAYSVSGAGDLNGDGFDDIVIGAPYNNVNGNSSGSIVVIFGKAGGFAAILKLSELDDSNGADGFRIYGVDDYDQLGISVSGAGDINGDGIDDLIVGARNAATGADSFGASYILFGKTGGFGPSVDLSDLDGSNGFRIDGGFLGQGVGSAVSHAGDVNGDGYADLIIGEPYNDDLGSDQGFSYVVFGRQTAFPAVFELASLDGTNGFRLDGVTADDNTGISVSAAGDINGDGFDDVIVGAYGTDFYGSFSGSSYVVFGKENGHSANFDLNLLDGSNGFRLDGPTENGYFGWSVSGAGDVNSDGFDDLIIGAWGNGPYGENSGAGYVVFGTDDGFPATLNVASLNGSNGYRIDPDGSFYLLGYSVSGAGDVNEDGFDDMIIGAFYQGLSYVVLGRGSQTQDNNSPTGSVFITGVATENQSLTASHTLVDADGLGEIKYQWKADGVRIPNATGTEYALGESDVGKVITVTASYRDNDGSYESVSSAPTAAVQSVNGVSLVIDGGPGDDDLTGANANDTIRGYDGRDTLEGGKGNDHLEGGNDIDLALFSNNLSDYSITNNAGVITVSGPVNNGTDTLIGVERLQFSDLALAYDLNGNAGTIAKVLGVVLGKNNWYNREYMGIGIDLLDNNDIPRDILMGLAFGAILGPNPSNRAVVNLVYTNLVGQAPSESDLTALTVNYLDSGLLSQGGLGVLAMDYVLNLNNIDIVGLANTGVEYLSLG